MNDEDHTESGQPPATPYRPLRLNLDEYMDGMEDENITEEQAAECLTALWEMMRMFVEIGWGVNQLQLFSSPDPEISGRDSENMLHKIEPNQTENTRREVAQESEES